MQNLERIHYPSFINFRKDVRELIRGGSRTAATFKIEPFVIIVNSFQPSTLITECSILDAAAVLDSPLLIPLIFLILAN